MQTVTQCLLARAREVTGAGVGEVRVGRGSWAVSVGSLRASVLDALQAYAHKFAQALC